MSRLWALAAALLFALILPSVAQAQSCSIAVSTMDFGAADLLPGTPVDITANVTSTCTGMPAGSATYYCIGFGPGSGGVSGSSRLLTGPGGATLKFGIYAESSHTYSWGLLNYPALGTAYGQAGNTATISAPATLYGRISATQSTAPTGSYSSSYSGANDVSLYTLTGGATSCSNGAAAASPKATTTFTVNATPAPHCTLSTTNVSFGAQGVLTANVDATGGVSVQCTTALPYTVGLSNGGTGTSPTARKMTSGANSLIYGLYQDAARSQAWGATSGVMPSGTGNGGIQSYTVYGRVAPQATPAAGSYSDTVNVTISY